MSHFILQDVTQLQYLKPELLPLLSNSTGIERSLVDCGVKRNVNEGGQGSTSANSSSIGSSSNGKTNLLSTKNGGGVKRTGSNSSNTGTTPGNKLPKWFKPGKPAPK